MKTFVRICILVGFAVLAVSSLYATPRQILLRVEPADLAWGVSALEDKLTWQLSKAPDVRVRCPRDFSADLPPFPSAVHDVDSLFEWGREVGGRFLLVVIVHREQLLTRKSFSIPLIVHMWEKVGVIEGEVRLLDLQRGRLLMAEPFAEEIRGRRVLQGDPDTNKDDPDLHVPAAEKKRLFGQLEDKLAERLVKKVNDRAWSQ